jgi:hypothetical protein
MKNKIEARLDPKQNIENNSIELLKAIKEHLLDYQEHPYTILIIVDSMRTLLNTREKENKNPKLQKDFESQHKCSNPDG